MRIPPPLYLPISANFKETNPQISTRYTRLSSLSRSQETSPRIMKSRSPAYRNYVGRSTHFIIYSNWNRDESPFYRPLKTPRIQNVLMDYTAFVYLQMSTPIHLFG